MPRTVIIDANVINHLNKGNHKAAKALQQLLGAGDTVYISRQAYNELTAQPGKMIAGVGPDLPRTAAANRKLITDLGIKIAPDGAFKDRGKVYERNSSLSTPDVMVAAQARAINAELWSFDRAMRKDPRNISKSMGIKVAPETQTAYVDPKTLPQPDYRVARRLMRLAPVEITVSGSVVKPIPGNSKPGGPKPKPRNRAVMGVAARPPSLSAPTTSRGAKIGQGVELGLSGVNFVVQKINDAVQAKRLKADWARIKPGVERNLSQSPSLGALIMVRFGKRKKRGAEHDSPLEHVNQFLSIEVAYGATESEAWENHILQPRLRSGAGLEVSINRNFIPPSQPLDVRKLRTPFTAYGVGTFRPGRESLLNVAWKGTLGFDEEDDVKLPVEASWSPRFLLLIAPNEIIWYNGPYRNTSDVPLAWPEAASAVVGFTRPVSVVDMDRGFWNTGNDTAAMVFPADTATARLFGAAPETKDRNGQLRSYRNIDMMRWVRPQNIHVLSKFLEEDNDRDSSMPVRITPREAPIRR